MLSVSFCYYTVMLPTVQRGFLYTVMHTYFHEWLALLDSTLAFHCFVPFILFFRYCSYPSFKCTYHRNVTYCVLYICLCACSRYIQNIQSWNESYSNLTQICIHLYADTFSCCKKKKVTNRVLNLQSLPGHLLLPMLQVLYHALGSSCAKLLQVDPRRSRKSRHVS